MTASKGPIEFVDAANNLDNDADSLVEFYQKQAVIIRMPSSKAGSAFIGKSAWSANNTLANWHPSGR
jgi:hypothetical protein